MTLSIEDIINAVLPFNPGLMENRNWGERGIFFNPDNRLPKGIYVLTFKEKDGPNDSASALDRGGRYRLNLGLSPQSFRNWFGPPPPRPRAGSIVATGHDFTTENTVMPHPVYGWMGWIGVINPSAETFERLKPVIAESIILAEKKFAQRIRRAKR